jgi:NAD(P)-dependent dehydrogenase (short-subunit alcohol dehydrogenase family)
MNEIVPGERRLAGDVAIVTGGGSGIGRAVCLALSAEGATVIVADLNDAGVKTTIGAVTERNCGALPIAMVADVRKEEDMERMAHETLQRFGRIDILVACAGILRARGCVPKPMVDLATEEWNEVLDTNLKGIFLSNRAVLPAMISQRRGNVLNVSSTAGRQGRPHDSAYCASKFGVIGLSEALAAEVSQYGIRVQVILPDAVDTPIWEQNGPIRAERALDPSRVADLIIYLVTLPSDTIMGGMVIAPFRARRRKAPAESSHAHRGSVKSPF